MSYEEEINDRDKDKIKMELEKIGCVVEFTEDKWFRIKGDLSKIKAVSYLLKAMVKDTKSVDNKNCDTIISIPMSNRDYDVLKFFGDKRNWFKQCRNVIYFDGHGLACVVSTVECEKIREDIRRRQQEVNMMAFMEAKISDESKMYIPDLTEENPNVYIRVNDKNIEIISDSYEDVLTLQNMLEQKATGKSNRRTARRFSKQP